MRLSGATWWKTRTMASSLGGQQSAVNTLIMNNLLDSCWLVLIRKVHKSGAQHTLERNLNSSTRQLIPTFLCVLTNKLFRGQRARRQAECEVVNFLSKWQRGTFTVLKTGVQMVRRLRWMVLPIQLYQPVRNRGPIGTCFMLMIIGWWIRQALAQMYFSNINSWRVFYPLDGASCFWQVRRKSRAAKYVWSLKTTVAVVNVGKSQRLFIWTLLSSISLNPSPAQRQLGREQQVIADIQRSKVTSAGWLKRTCMTSCCKKAEMFTGFCTLGSIVHGEKQACLWQRQNEGLLWTSASICDTGFWQQPPCLSLAPAVCDYAAKQLNWEVICDYTFVPHAGLECGTICVLLRTNTVEIV